MNVPTNQPIISPQLWSNKGILKAFYTTSAVATINGREE
jgi:hypothetical protein